MPKHASRYLVALALASCLAAGFLIPFPQYGKLNLKTGCLRSYYLLIPVSSSNFRQEAQWQGMGLPDDWQVVVTYPLLGSNNPAAMVRSFMSRILVWDAYDHDLGKLLADDLAEYVVRTGCQSGLPRYFEAYTYIDLGTHALRTDIDQADLDVLKDSDDRVHRLMAKIIEQKTGVAK